MPVEAPQDKGVSWYIPHIHNVRFMKARYIRHAFRPHSHDYWVIGLVESGLQTFMYKKQRLMTPPGRLIIINPGEVHTGEAAISDGFVYRALYPPLELMEDISVEFAVKPGSIPVFRGGIINNAMLYQRIKRLHRHSEQFSTLLQVEADLTRFFVDLIKLHAEADYTIRDYKKAPREIALVREYMEAHFSDPIALSDLSTLTNVSPYHLSRLFKRHMNVPPHRYLENVRVKHAEQMLKDGVPIAEVAFQTGFSSQSHLTRTFKHFLGITPGDLVKARKIV